MPENGRSRLGKDVFSTGQIAQLALVAPRTVQQWIDWGRLPAYRLPTGPGCQASDRRVLRADLLAFARASGITPLLQALEGHRTAFEAPTPTLVACGVPDGLWTLLGPLLTDWLLVGVDSMLAAGVALPRDAPAVLLLGPAVSRGDVRHAAGWLNGHIHWRLVALLGDDQRAVDHRHAGIAATCHTADDPARLADVLHTLYT